MSDTSEQKIALSKLPSGGDILVGRESELALLDESLASDSTRVISFVAWGGTGKSALADHWMNRVSADKWRGIDRYFDWSFYSQGTRGEQGTSADLFVAEALKFFGDPNPQAGSPHDRGERLAKLAAEHRTLLILDGLEPMQFGPGPQEGQVKDPALWSLLRSLAQRPFDGLCVLTTREHVTDLERFHDTTVVEKKLENLSPLAGAKLLHLRGVDHAGAGKLQEDDKELRDAAEEVDGHALTLQLMGNYLKRAHGGDVRRKDRFGFEPAMKNAKDYHAFRAIAVYERWLSGKLEVKDDPEQHEQQYDREQGERMLAVLRMLGLFDRPARPDCLDALRQNPILPGLNEPLVDLDDEEWNGVLSDLEKLELVKREDSDQPPAKIVDAHPLIREYFAKQLKPDQAQPERVAGVEQREPPESQETGGSLRSTPATPETQDTSSWTEGHRRVFEHLCENTEHRPATIEGLAPLYQAVAHGCHAGLHEKARADVYRDRILRGTGNNGFYSTKKLGAIGADLGAVACFFDRPWNRPSPHLSPAAQASIDMAVEQEDWLNAAIYAGNLSELELTLGEVSAAVADGEQSVTFADRSGDEFQRMGKRTTHADALHQASRGSGFQPEDSSQPGKRQGLPAAAESSSQHGLEGRATARQLFAEAEVMQAGRQPQYPRLYSLPGFKYCDLLLSGAERAAWQSCCGTGFQPVERDKHGLEAPATACDDVTERAASELRRRKNLPTASILDIALDHLTLSRAALYRWLIDGPPPRVEAGDSGSLAPCPSALTEHLAPAVDGLREAGAAHHIPRGLLTRAWQRALTDDAAGAVEDLDEAWEIAERGPMPLYQADILLTRARLFFRDDLATAWENLNEAKRLVNKHGYHRRDEEIADAEEAFRIWQENHPAGESSVPVLEDSSPEETDVARDQVFISYSREDSRFMKELKVHLKPYKLPKWIDTDIKVGANWKDELQAAVQKTRVAVFLVSPNSLASDFINDEELGPLLVAKEAGEVTIVWVQLRACAYDQTPLKDLQAVFSPPGDPVAGLSKADRAAAWLEVSREVKKALGP